jgi:hypothetical protein
MRVLCLHGEPCGCDHRAEAELLDVGPLHEGGIKKATDGICVSFFKKTVA